MPSATALYNTGRWLNASDLVNSAGLNKRITAIVHHAEPELIGQGNDQKTLIMLELVSRNGQPWPKKLPLNKTNTLTMVAAYGDDYSAWASKAIEVWAENTMFSGKILPGLKVAAAANGAAPVPQQAIAAPQAPAQAAPPPSATAVAGMPPATGPTWMPNKQPNMADLDDEIPF